MAKTMMGEAMAPSKTESTKKGSFMVDKLDKGFKVCVCTEQDAPEGEGAGMMYPMMDRKEGAFETIEQVRQAFEKWAAGKDAFGA